MGALSFQPPVALVKDLVAKLTIEASTAGEDKIAAIARELEQLAAQGLAATPAFQELANELRALQAAQPAGLDATASQVGALGSAAAGASPAVDGLSGALADVAQPVGLDTAASQVGALGSAAAGASPAVDGLSGALADVAQPAGLDATASQVGALGSAAAGASPAVDGLSGALADVAQPAGLDAAASQVGALGSAAAGASPAVDGLSGALADVAQPAGLDAAASQVGALGSAAAGASPAVDGLSGALADVAQPAGLDATASQVGALGSAAAGASPAVDGLSGALADVAQPAGLDETAGQLGAVGGAAAGAEAPVGALGRQAAALGEAAADSADALDSMGSAAQDARGGMDELSEGATGAADAVNELAGAQPEIEGLAKAIAAIFALTQLKQAAGSAIELADAFGQMSERIRMATDGADEYEYVQRRLLDTANATYRPLEEQQELYIRTADALRSLGLSTRQAVDVTDAFSFLLTTNAASADRAKSAIDAYSKSLAAGKVDVDAWMSITTAMPTVVDAIAASMSITTAEVRALGVNGGLSLEALNQALLQTRDAAEQAAAGMDATLADALQRLRNNWGEYVKGLNESYGVTEKLVGGLVLLSENLEAIGTAAAATGFVALVAAVTAAEIKLYGYIVALKAYIGTAAGAAAATTALKVALGNLAAGTWIWAIYKNVEAWEEYRERVQAAEDATLNLAANQTRAAKKFEDISRATGVTVTSMAELNAAMADGRIHFDQLTASWKAGADNTVSAVTRLGHATAELVDTFTQAANKKDALAALSNAFDPASVVHVQNFTRALAELQRTGQLSAAEVAEAWDTALDKLDGAQLLQFAQGWQSLATVGAEAAAGLTAAFDQVGNRLDKLSATELQKFQTLAVQAFNEGTLSAEKFAALNDAVLSASFAKLGVNAAQAMGTISAASADAIAALDLVDSALQASEASATQVATALELAFGQSIAKADSLEAIAELEARLKSMGDASKIGADGIARISAEIDKQRAKIEDQIPGIQSLEEAYRTLGLKSAAELNALAAEAKQAFDVIRESGKAAPEMLKAAFTEYAEAAVAANGGVADASVKAQAAQLGLKVEVDDAGKVIVRSMKEAAEAVKEVEETSKDAADASEDMADASEDVADGLNKAADASSSAATASRGVSTAWVDAAKAGSQYAAEAGRYAQATYEAQMAMMRGEQTVWSYTRALSAAMEAGKNAAAGYIGAMETLDRQQAALNNSALDGYRDMELQLLRLTGTREQIAAAEKARDEAAIQRQIALAKIEAQRANMRGEGDEARRLQEEIKLYEKQLGLLDKIYREQEKQAKAAEKEAKRREQEAEREAKRRERERKEAERERERERNSPSNGGGGRGTDQGGRPGNGVGGTDQGGRPGNGVGGTDQGGRPVPQPAGPITLNINLPPAGPMGYERGALEQFARQLGPVITDLQRKGAL